VRVFAGSTLAACGSDGALLEIPHPPARVGCLSMRGASWLHRGSKITFVPRGHVRACHSQDTYGQQAEQDCSGERVPHVRGILSLYWELRRNARAELLVIMNLSGPAHAHAFVIFNELRCWALEQVRVVEEPIQRTCACDLHPETLSPHSGQAG
jgi:hypothetical protein